MHMKLFLGKFSFSINSITFVSQLSHIKKIYVPTTVFIVTKVFSSICFQFLLTECSNRVNLQYISQASKMADSDNNQLMNCKNFVILRNIFNYCKLPEFLSEKTLLYLNFLKKISEMSIVQSLV